MPAHATLPSSYVKKSIRRSTTSTVTLSITVTARQERLTVPIMVPHQDSNCPRKASNSAIAAIARNGHAPKNAPKTGGCDCPVPDVNSITDSALMPQSLAVAGYVTAQPRQLSVKLSGFAWGWPCPWIHNPRVRDSKSLGYRSSSDSPCPWKASKQAGIPAWKANTGAAGPALAPRLTAVCPPPVPRFADPLPTLSPLFRNG